MARGCWSEIAKEEANCIRCWDFMLPFVVEKLQYVESFTQARLTEPDDNVDCIRVHLSMAVTQNQELSQLQFLLGKKTYAVIYELNIHQVALPILGYYYLSPMDVMK
jgi:hypothetical protein